MSKRLDNKTIQHICCTALRIGMPATADHFGLSKQRVSAIFRCHKSTVFMSHELYKNNGKERNFKELRVIFNSPL